MSIINKLTIVLTGILLTACIKDDVEASYNLVQVKDSVPYFSITEENGSTFTSDAFVGKKSLLVFFYTECKDCQRVLPVVEEAWRKIKDNPDCLVVTIAREQTKKETDIYWEEKEFTMPRFHDPERKVYSLFATQTVPRCYIINSENIIEWMEVEDISFTADELVNRILSAK